MEKEKASVLFLEDDPVIREVLTEYMHMSGYRVTEAQRGDDAISLLARQQFHLAVLDICVPGVDGFGVLKYIQENCRTAVIMLTALGDEQRWPP